MVKSKSSSYNKVIKSIKKINDIHANFGELNKMQKEIYDFRRDKENNYLKHYHLAHYLLIKLDYIVEHNVNDIKTFTL